MGFIGSCLLKLLCMTLRFDDEPKGFIKKTRNRQVIYAFWHCMILVPGYVGRSWRIQVLISRHSDGEYIAQVVKWMGYGVVRGSTTRGGMRAVKLLVDKARQGYPLGITPDGPKGPRFVAQTGIIFLSQKTGLPIVPVVAGLSRYWELPSWDRFRIPKPFSRALLIFGDPIHIPPKLTEEEMEHYRLSLENTMKQLVEKADKAVCCKT